MVARDIYEAEEKPMNPIAKEIIGKGVDWRGCHSLRLMVIRTARTAKLQEEENAKQTKEKEKRRREKAVKEGDRG